MSHTLSNSTQFTSLHVCWSDFILSPEFHQDNKNILLYFTKCVNVYDMLVSQCSPDWLYSPELNPLKKYACILLSVSAFPFISKVSTDMQVNVWLIIFYLLSEIKVLVINVSVLSQVCVCVCVCLLFCWWWIDTTATPAGQEQTLQPNCFLSYEIYFIVYLNTNVSTWLNILICARINSLVFNLMSNKSMSTNTKNTKKKIKNVIKNVFIK